MIYVFDNSPLSTLFRNYYRRRFPTLWRHFEELVDEGDIVSTREALREIEDGAVESLRVWAEQNNELFTMPNAEEGAFVAQIYAVRHFQQNIERQKMLKGGRNADPFIIAKAAVTERTVVTMERRQPNSAKIPNICDHFGIPCITLEDFVETEGWEF